MKKPAKLTSATLLDTALEAMLARADLLPTTHATYREAIARGKKLFGVLTVGQLGALQPRGIQAALDRARITGANGKPATVRLTLVVMRKLARFLMREDVIRVMPFRELEPVRVGNNVPEWNVLKPGELELLLAKLERTKDYEGHALVSLLALQGLRISEALALCWSHVVEVEGGLALVFTGKGRKEARLGLREPVRRSLERLEQGEGRIITRWSNRHHVRTWLVELTQRLVGHRVTPHGLRATFISNAISKVGIEAARQLARQANITTTQRYSRWQVSKMSDLDKEE